MIAAGNIRVTPSRSGRCWGRARGCQAGAQAGRAEGLLLLGAPPQGGWGMVHAAARVTLGS